MEPRKGISVVQIEVPSRLHLTLLAMHRGEYRINGGIGFTVNAPSVIVKTGESERTNITDMRSDPLSKAETERLIEIIHTENTNCGFIKQIEVEISGSMPTHSGFGSGTAITLACLEGLHILNDSKLSNQKLIEASGRGGTSGVGIHTYFSGGYVFDLGRATSVEQHLPSHAINVTSLPLLVDRGDMPDWEIGICIPKIPKKTQLEEREFFKRICPITANGAYEATYHTLFGLYSAIRERNLPMFSLAIKSIQKCVWKNAERTEYGDGLLDCENKLYDLGVSAVGMTSLGPGLFFIGENTEEICSTMQKNYPEHLMFSTVTNNVGRNIKI